MARPDAYVNITARLMNTQGRLLFLRDWLKNHILGTDRHLAAALLLRIEAESLPVMPEPDCCRV